MNSGILEFLDPRIYSLYQRESRPRVPNWSIRQYVQDVPKKYVYYVYEHQYFYLKSKSLSIL